MNNSAQANRRRTALLALQFAVVIVAVVFVVFTIAGAPLVGLVAGLIIGGASLALAWSKATEVVLDLSEAEAADEVEHARLFNAAAGLCAAMGVSPPNLYVVDDPAINALAVGVDPRNASIAVTSGALDNLELVELEGIVALQLQRIKSHDIVPATFAVTTVALPVTLSEMADRWPPLSRALALPAPLATAAIARLRSKREELDTDVEAVRYTRFPPGLATCLAKMKGRSALVAGAAVTAHLWTASPMAPTSKSAPVVHATLDERVAVLQEL